GIEPRKFPAEFRRRHGMSFPDYLNVLRVEEARALLASSDLPVTRIALQTGFNNTAYFNRTFKRLTRLVPVEYRRRHRVR
ncbi:MAG: AraC family transcriptional regulator, partial [Spirochaetia bacterium]|nr:AraC family transcriptional regulator [Spirochaetia bacterium]